MGQKTVGDNCKIGMKHHEMGAKLCNIPQNWRRMVQNTTKWEQNGAECHKIVANAAKEGLGTGNKIRTSIDFFLCYTDRGLIYGFVVSKWSIFFKS